MPFGCRTAVLLYCRAVANTPEAQLLSAYYTFFLNWDTQTRSPWLHDPFRVRAHALKSLLTLLQAQVECMEHGSAAGGGHTMLTASTASAGDAAGGHPACPHTAAP